MSSRTLPLGPKPADYFEHDRADLVARLPRPLGRTLDVGCGAGRVGAQLRAAGADELVGIELDPDAAARAEAVFDQVLCVDAAQAVDEFQADAQFDTIVCYDILEHLFDPVAVLQALRAVAAPGARLHVSIPNARHAGLLRDLLLRGTFGYTAWGHRDSTHLRWFTRQDIVALLEETGWRVRLVSTGPHTRRRTALIRLSRGKLEEFLANQWYVLCDA
jgi:2-polyprenyl-3-methyl-5-hydroxy-6-metoxy-1,4-benzoquinol methylase